MMWHIHAVLSNLMITIHINVCLHAYNYAVHELASSAGMVFLIELNTRQRAVMTHYCA